MKRSVVQVLVLLTAFVVFFGTALYYQHKGLEKVRVNEPFIESWQLGGRSGEVLKLMALRYDLAAADFLWLRAIQSFGGRGMTNRDWEPLYNMFDTITELDPYFEYAYTFGNMVIGDEGGKQREGLGLLNKGTFKLWRHYRCPFEGMYVAHFQMRNALPLARWYGRIASKRQDAPDWVPRMAAFIEVKSGAFYIGYDRFLTNLLQAVDADDVTLEQIALLKLKETIDTWNRELMLQAMDEFTTRTGRLPTRIEELADMPALQNYEIARMSRALLVANALALRLGKNPMRADILKNMALPSPAEVEKFSAETTAPTTGKLADLQNVAFQATIERRSGIPESPDGTPYVLNLTAMGAPDTERVEWVTTTANAEKALNRWLFEMRAYITERTEELGRPPTDLREAFQTDFKTTETFGGQWMYNKDTGDLRSSSRPTLPLDHLFE